MVDELGARTGERRALYVGSSARVAEVVSAFATRVDVLGVNEFFPEGVRGLADDNTEVIGAYSELADALREPLVGTYDIIVVGGPIRRRGILDPSADDVGLGISDAMIDTLLRTVPRTLVFYELRILRDDVKVGKKCMTKFARHVRSRGDYPFAVHALYGGAFDDSDVRRGPLIIEHLLSRPHEPGAYGHTTAQRAFAKLRKRPNLCTRPVPDAVRSVLGQGRRKVDVLGVSRDGVEVVSTKVSAASAIEQCRALRQALAGTGYSPVITQDSVESMHETIEDNYLDLARIEPHLQEFDYEDTPLNDEDSAIDDGEQTAGGDTTPLKITSCAPADPCRIVLVPDPYGGALSPLVCMAGPQLSGYSYVARLKHWHEAFGASVLLAGPSMELDVARPPRDLRIARQLADYHLGTVDGLGNIKSALAYARWLQQSPRWSFWYD